LPEHGEIEQQLAGLNIAYAIHPFSYNTSSRPFTLRGIRAKLKKLRAVAGLYKLIKPYNPTLFFSNSSVIYYGFFLSRLFRVKHIWYLREFGKDDYGLYHDFGIKIFKYLLSLNDRNIAISSSVKAYYELSEKMNTCVIYNGIVSENELNKITCKQFNGRLNFGMIGIIRPYKNQLEVIRSFHRYLNIAKVDDVLMIYGELGKDVYNQEMQKYIVDNQLENKILLMGHIARRDHIYKSLDILIHGAKFEAFGRVTAEAMSYGVVPVGFNSCGTSEIIRDTINGYLFNDFDELPLLLLNIRSNLNELTKLQHNLPLTFNREFTTERNAQQLDSALHELLRSNKN